MSRGRPPLSPGDRTSPVRLPDRFIDRICHIANLCHLSMGEAFARWIQFEGELQRIEIQWTERRLCFGPLHPPVLIPNQGERIAAALAQRRVTDANGNIRQMFFNPRGIGEFYATHIHAQLDDGQWVATANPLSLDPEIQQLLKANEEPLGD